MKVWRFTGPGFVKPHSYAYVRVPFWLVGKFIRDVLPKHPGMYRAEPWMSGPRSYGAQFILTAKPRQKESA